MIRALDGSTIDASGVGFDHGPWAFRAWHTSRRNGVNVLMSGDAGVNEGAPLPDAVKVSEAKAGKARLLALADPDRERHQTTTFVYVGPHHEISLTRVGTNIPMDLFVEYLSGLDITDSPEGIAATPKPGSGARMDLHLGMVSAGDIAFVNPFFTPQAISGVPSHRGRPTRGGELWKVDSPEGVLIANSTSVTKVEPFGDLDSPAFIALAESLRITRTAA